MAEITDAVRESLSLLTMESVCELLHCKKGWLYKEVEHGRFPVVRVGRQLRFRPADIEAYINGQYEPPAAPEPEPAGRPDTAPVRRGPRKSE